MSVPKFLYKYRALSPGDTRDRTLDIIRSNRLYFCSPSSFNDPFEAQFVLRVGATRDERLRYWSDGFIQEGQTLESAKSRAEAWNAIFISFPDKLHEAEFRPVVEAAICRSSALLSLSARPDDLLMWAHYAASHTGLCLKFSLSAEEPFFAVAQPVDYQDDYPQFNYFTSSSDEKLKRSLLTKSRHWEYEAEYRVIDSDGAPGLRSFHPSLLAGVILGARISETDREEVVALVGARAPIYRAELDRSQFRVNIVAV
jgi:hypothetical protein